MELNKNLRDWDTNIKFRINHFITQKILRILNCIRRNMKRNFLILYQIVHESYFDRNRIY